MILAVFSCWPIFEGNIAELKIEYFLVVDGYMTLKDRATIQ